MVQGARRACREAVLDDIDDEVYVYLFTAPLGEGVDPVPPA